MMTPVFRGLRLALSTTGAVGECASTRRELEELIVAHGGAVSRVLHKNVSLLVCTDEALTKNTQHVRKARKFGVAVVRPSFLLDSVARDQLCEPALHEPEKRDSAARRPHLHVVQR